MEIRFWGVRGSIAVSGPRYMRTGGNTTCVELTHAGERLILDGGTGLRALGESLGFAPVEATLLFTHLHWDHIQGVPFFGPAFHPESRLTLAGVPRATGTVREALAAQMRPPTFPVTLDRLVGARRFVDVPRSGPLEFGPFRVTPLEQDHPDGVVAYRVEAGDRVVVFATDCEHRQGAGEDSESARAMAAFARGADMLIHDAQYTTDEYFGRRGPPRLGWGHSTVDDAVAVARRAECGRLALFHHDPGRDDAAVEALEQAARVHLPGAFAAREGEGLALTADPAPLYAAGLWQSLRDSMAADHTALSARRAVDSGQQVDLEELLRAAIDEVARQLGADRGTLYLVDHARGELVSRVAHLPELAEIRLRLGEGIAGWVAAHGEAVIIPGATEDPRFAQRVDLATGYRTRTLLAVPVDDAQGQRIGVLQVLNKARGAFDVADLERLRALAAEVARLLEDTSLRSQLRPGQSQSLDFRFNGIVGVSPAMRDVYARTTRAAATDATVLVQGESGSGKELIARAVHCNSPRRDGPFVKVDCAALPASLIENELFGHERGAFTGADRATDGKVQAAHGGTLFLDEVGELPLAVQGKLLRLLQEKTCVRVGGTTARQVDVRFVCATHRDLEADVASGRFRQDLFYRLRVVPILLPPLRQRGAVDLDRLIDHLLFEWTRRHGRPALRLGPEARTALHAHAWPGNVRELENALEAAVVLAPGPMIEVEHLGLTPMSPIQGAPAVTAPSLGDAFTTPVDTLEAVERRYIEHVLRLAGGNRTQAARRLGIGRNTLLRKLEGDDPV